MTTKVGIFEAKNRLSELVERAAHGEEIVITRRGEPVARLLGPTSDESRQKAADAIRRLKQARQGVRLAGIPLRELIAEGRR